MADPVSLVTIQQVATRMQLDLSLDGIGTALESAIAGAQLSVEAILGNMDLAHHQCLYYLDRDAFSGIQPGGRFRLELPAYFIRENDADYPLIMTWGRDWKTVDNPMDMSLYRVDKKNNSSNGQILVDADTYGDYYVQVDAWTGFKGGDVDSNGDPIPPEPIPDWVAESVISYVGVVLSDNQNSVGQSVANSAGSQYKNAAARAENVLLPYLRTRGFVLRPQ